LSRTLHIAALASYRVFPAKMGGQKGIACFYSYLGVRVPVSFISTKNNEFPAGFPATFIPLLGNSFLRYVNPFLFFPLRKILLKDNITHLILEHPYYGWLGTLLKWTTKVKLVVHSHNIESLRFKSTGRWWWRILWQYEKFTHRRADLNFFITGEDEQFAIKHFKLDARRCQTITYGSDAKESPMPSERSVARQVLENLYGIGSNEKILLFNGTLDYKPNLDALMIILNVINPALMKQAGFNYRIIICGKSLPANLDELKAYQDKHIIYAGFVDDITVYFKGCDLFINPVTDGGGIKTKLVEALGYNISCISTESGAIGIPQSITGKKLVLTGDTDWEPFTKAIIDINTQENIPNAFYNHFYWGNIADKAASVLKNTALID